MRDIGCNPKVWEILVFFHVFTSPNGGNSCKKNMEIPGGNLTVTGKLENGEFINWGDYHPSTFTGLIQGPFPTWILYHANMAVSPATKGFAQVRRTWLSPAGWGKRNTWLKVSIRLVELLPILWLISINYICVFCCWHMFTIESCVFGLCIPRILLGSCWPYFPMKIPSFSPFFVDLKRLGGLFLSCTKRKRPLRKQPGSNDDKLPVGHLIHNFGDGNLKQGPDSRKSGWSSLVWQDPLLWVRAITFEHFSSIPILRWVSCLTLQLHQSSARMQRTIAGTHLFRVLNSWNDGEKHIWLQNVADFGIIILYHGTIQMVHKWPPCPMVFTTSSESMMQPAQVPHTGLGFRFSPSAPGPEVKTSGETLTTRTALSEWNGQDVAGQSQMKCWQPPRKTCHVLSPKMFFYM